MALEQLNVIVEELQNIVTAINGNVVTVKSAILDHTDWTDGGSAAGTIAAGITLPVGAIVDSIKMDWSAETPDVNGAAGETTMTLQVGTAADPDRFMQATNYACTIATGLPESAVQVPTNPSDAGDGDIVVATAVAVLITGTLSGGTPDMSNFINAGGAGKLVVTIQYRATANL